NNGCTDDTTINITITPGSLADFSALTVCEGSTTNFIDGSLPNGTVVNWDWDFDNDGTVDNTNQNPNFTFPNAGTYSVSLSVSGAGNSCPHDTIIDVIVSPVPIVNFSASTECFGTITTFIDSSNISSGTITNWNWDFDNNGTVDNTNQNPTNVFSSAGTHTVNLSVGVGSCTHDTTLTVVVKPSPIANFTTNLTSVCLGTSIVFNSTSSAVFPSVIDSLQWDFDNDGTIDDITPSTTYTYSSIGNHTITLVTYSNGCVDDTTIVITVVPGTVADFSADTVCAGSITNFVDGSIPNGTVVNWGWDFDNNGTIDNSNQNPSFTFSNAGTYSVSLSVSGVGGSCPHDTVIDIIVSTVPVSNFSASNQCEGTPINFIDLSVGSVTGWNWDFDNNGTVDNTNQNPSNIFTIAGTYLVNLNVESGSCSHDTTINIIVDPMPLANFSATSECSGVAVVFTDMSNSFGGSITSWNWDFDNDGTVDNTIQNPNNIFTVAGTYPVNLSVEMGTCTHDTVINVFVSVSNFSAALDFTPPTPCGQDSFNVVLNFIGLGADSLVWNMGDGTTFENITSVDYSYIDAGTYPISMTVYNYACNIVKTINSQVIFFDVPDSESIVPNVFTPNGDGINDELIVLGVDETAEFEIKIFNRWGKLVFESSSLINNWDGKVGNDVGSAGTYFYILIYTDVCNEEIKISKGAVTLLK
ncbi:MAG: PKD domain-containing protein, partial [Flavobacteriales bacterium]|nr:PKD domain-containing protein [Flavobacteriales bacterium]